MVASGSIFLRGNKAEQLGVTMSGVIIASKRRCKDVWEKEKVKGAQENWIFKNKFIKTTCNDLVFLLHSLKDSQSIISAYCNCK